MSCDLPEFVHQSRPRARKTHKCCECRGEIRPGEAYESVRGRWAGEFAVYKTCDSCAQIRQRVRSLMPSETLEDGYPYYGGLFEERDYYPEAWE